MNPYTGEILAMANYPTYDPNVPAAADEPEEARSNLAIATPFEPGSVFKTITLSAALETTKITSGHDDQLRQRSDQPVRPHHSRSQSLRRADHGRGAGEIEQHRRDPDRPEGGRPRRCTNTSHNFGFGQKTGIELPGESAGLVRRVEDWTPSSIGSVAMGHEMSATSIQLAVAGAVIANGGLMVKPQIVLSRQKPGEASERFAPEKPVESDRAGDGDSDAPDDGRRGVARHRPRPARI